MNKPAQFKRAFTLLEVLIATSIFAVVMVMTTGVIAQSTSYQTKTKALRDASEETGRISDVIARDLKTAEGAITILNNLGSVTVVRSFKNGVALIDGVSSAFVGATSPIPYPTGSTSMNATNYPASSLIINTKDSIKVYTTKADISGQNTVYAKTYVKADTAPGSLIEDNWLFLSPTTLWLKSVTKGSLITAITSDQANKISTTNPDNALDTAVAFSGYTASDATTAVKAQSYIAYYVHSSTKDFATLPPTSRSESYVRSMVTMRNYSN